MDYYNLTVFEFVTTRLGSQGTICAGGRYDYLIEQVGGKPAAAVGWAMGVERVLELLKEQGSISNKHPLDAYAIVSSTSALPQVSVFLQKMRELGLSIQMHTSSAGDMGSMKSQFKRADASGARYALVFGPDELALGKVAVKSLRDATSAQVLHPLDEIDIWAKGLQFNA
jgi:histidyl-tRNA synthetase